MKNVKYKKRRGVFTILILFSFMLSVLPGGMRDIRAEELIGEEPVEAVELLAEVIWTGIPEEMTIPNTTLKLMSGEDVVESIEVTDGSLEVKFTPVAKFNDAGEEILYSVSQDPLENFTTEIKDFVVENTYEEPVIEVKAMAPVEEPVEEPKVEVPAEEPKVEEPAEEPKVEEPVEEPKVEEPAEEPKVEVPAEEPKVEVPAEEPKVGEPAEEPKVEVPVEEPKVEESVVDEELTSEELIDAETIDGEMDPSMIGKPVGPDGVILGAEMPYTSPGSADNDLLPVAETFNRSMVSTQTSTLLPGQVIVDKYAKPVPGLVNTWDVTLRIEGKDDQKTSHIVLVIDRSGSMAGSKLDNAKIAAKNFVDALLVNPNTMIAVVSYSYGSGAYQATINSTFSASAGDLKAAIDTLSAVGGTNTQAGVIRADQMLSASGTADYKHIVLLSDGVPTQSFVINNLADSKFEAVDLNADTEYNGYVTEDNNIYYRTKSTLTDYNYNQTIGYGSAPYTRYDTYNNRYRYYSHGNSAIAQASIFKNNTVAGQTKTLWTIAYGVDGYGAQVLKDMASSDSNALLATASNLTETMAQIAGSINSAAKAVTVEDQIATGFEIPAASIGVYTKIPSSSTVAYDSSQKKLTWNVGDLVTTKPGDSTIKYAELTYRVHITDAILGETPVNNTYPTNAYAKANYTNSIGQPVNNIPFPIPRVNPIFLKVKKILQNSDGNVITDSSRSFDIRIKSDHTEEYDKTYTLKPDQYVRKTNLRLADTYTVSENAPDYDVIIKVNGVVKSTFDVIPPLDGITDSGQPDIYVEVINREKADGELTIVKKLVDGKGTEYTDNTKTFTFDIKGPGTYTRTETLKGGESVTITGLKYGIYTVTERDPGTGFTVTYNPVLGDPPHTKATVILDVKIKVGTVTVTNKARTSSLQLLKTGKNGVPLEGAEFELYRKVVSTTDGAEPFLTKSGETIYGIRIEYDTWPDGRLKTGSDGKTQIVPELEGGDYFVKELVAPEGYMIHEYPIEFEVLVTEPLNVIKIRNELAPKIPATGGMGTWLFTLLGFGIMSGALLSFKKHNHNNRGKGENVMKRNRLFTILFTFLLLFVFTVPGMARAEEIVDPPSQELDLPIGEKIGDPLEDLEPDPEEANRTHTIKTSKIRIHKMELFEVKTALPVNHNGKVLTNAELDAALGAGNYVGLPGVTFGYWIVSSSETLATLEAKFINGTLGAPDGTVGPTNALGEVDVTLPDGFYYFRETITPANVSQQIAVPFLLGLPVMNAEGTALLRDTIHIYPKNVTVRGSVELTKLDDCDKVIKGATFKLFKDTDPAVEYIPGEIYTTGSNGKIRVDNLPKGKYYFEEISVPSPWLLNTSKIKFEITKNTNLEVVKVSLKNFKGPEIEKRISSLWYTSASGDFGEKIPFFVTVKLPEDILTYSQLFVTDMIDTKLDYMDNVRVYGSTNGYTWTNLTPVTQYSIVNQPAVGADGLLKVNFVPAAMKSSHGTRFAYVRIVFDASINDTAMMGKCIENRATVTFNNGYLLVNKDIESNKVCAYTSGAKFKKWDGQVGLAGAEFAVKNSQGKFLKLEDGKYSWVNSLADTTFRVVSDANGYFEIKGLGYNLWWGTEYWLVETKAPMGPAGSPPYNIIETPIKFVVNGSSYYTHNPYRILNKLGPKIPQTGGIGTAVFSVIGAGLMGSALLLNKKKRR